MHSWAAGVKGTGEEWAEDGGRGDGKQGKGVGEEGTG